MSKKVSKKDLIRDAESKGVLTKLTLFFFRWPVQTAVIWLILGVFGFFSYTTFLKKEGFPSVSIPITIVAGGYFADDAAKVDADIAQPFSRTALQFEGVKSVQTQSQANFFNAVVNYSEGIDAQVAAQELEAHIQRTANLPQQAQLLYSAPYFGATGGGPEKLDIAISFFGNKDSSPEMLLIAAQSAVDRLNESKSNQIDRYFVSEQFSESDDPITGEPRQQQISFDRFGVREDGETNFYPSVIIGVSATESFDVIELDNEVEAELREVMANTDLSGFDAKITASFAPSIEENISELERVLLEGLLAVLVIGSLVIAIRASLITVISMVTVIAITLGLLYAIGYTLNVITLFALILGLSLIVDDTIIMIEALDVGRKRNKKPAAAVAKATSKVSRAMVAATTTAALSFAPLLFVGGVLGGFIRAIPVTIIASLAISLFVALIFIPLFARLLMLRQKHMGERGLKEVGAGFEEKIATFLTRPMIWARGSIRRLMIVGSVAVLVGLLFVGSAGFISRYVSFNIFPPSKDSNGIILTIGFDQDLSISQAEEVAGRLDARVADVVGDEFEYASYYGSGSSAQARLVIELKPYAQRDITAPQIVEKIKNDLNDFKGATVQVAQQDVGPPAADFTVLIESEDRDASFALAQDIAAFLRTITLERPSGEAATIRSVRVSSPNMYQRIDGALSVEVVASFEDTDTTTLVTLAQSSIEDRFTSEVVEGYGLKGDVMKFDFGQESENQDSFATLLYAFPAVLLVIYVLLAFQFRSLLQPLLIFLAIPFSLFGVTLGLYLTDNALSFFSMLGFFALIGLSIKNTILLVDYANQSRRDGKGVIDSAIEALRERFRPLIATSLTAVVSLIPLAIVSPFWQGLAVTLIFGLLSSTLLVVVVFPYYYLANEYLRMRINRRQGLTWLTGSLLLGVGGTLIVSPISLLVAPIVVALLMKYATRFNS